MTRLRHPLPAWLALAAMLVIFFAPVLSQSLAMTHERERTPVAVAIPAHAMSHQAHADMPQATATKARPAHEVAHRHALHTAHVAIDTTRPLPQDHFDLAQCGYCHLLVHFPLMVEPPFSLPPGRAGPAGIPQPATSAGHGSSILFPNALSRAPPRHNTLLT